MTANECIKGRRSIRKFKSTPITRDVLELIIETASFAPSWKNSQTIRYIAIEDPLLLQRIGNDCTSQLKYNGNTILNAPMLIAITVIKGRCGFERDGSFTTLRNDTWQMFDAGIASEAFCLAAYEQGIGSVILGIFDESKIVDLLQIPDDRELIALIPIGYPDENPTAPIRKAVEDLISYK